MKQLVFIFLLFPLMPAAAVVASDTNPIKAIIGAQIIDGLSDHPLKSNVILVEGNKILGIGDRSLIPDNATVIDLGTVTLMPGMIDCHSHPLLHTDDYQTAHIQTSSAYKALKGLKALQRALDAGWTSVRVAGDSDVYYGIMDIKRLIQEEVLIGPRIFGAAHYLSVTGGGGDLNYFSPEQSLIADGRIADGPDEFRRAVRTEAKYGADWIKVLITGAFMSVGDNPRSVHLSASELEALFDEAQRRGLPVMAHAHAAEGIKQAVKAGARSIEHGTYLDDEAIRLMKKHHTFLVPTLYIGDYYNDPRNSLREQTVNDEYSKNYRHIFYQKVGEAHRAGIRVVVGTDFGGYEYAPQMYAREFASLVEAGMSPMEAIKAGTSVAAELLQRSETLGSIQAGKFADIIALENNPLDDISELERVVFVMKNGQVIKQR